MVKSPVIRTRFSRRSSRANVANAPILQEPVTPITMANARFFTRSRANRLSALAAAAIIVGIAAAGPRARAEPARATYGAIPDAVWNNMQGKSWRAELPCPRRSELAFLQIPYLDFEGHTQIGSMIVAKSAAAKVAAAFQEIYDSKRFRIYRMTLIDDYQGDDDRSIEANNTSAFNCRTTDRGALSRHALGLAVDINPVQNPYRDGNGTAPEAGRAYDQPYKRRSDIVGIIVNGDVVTRAFARQGWRWGGNWKNSVDYQHFSSDGH